MLGFAVLGLDSSWSWGFLRFAQDDGVGAFFWRKYPFPQGTAYTFAIVRTRRLHESLGRFSRYTRRFTLKALNSSAQGSRSVPWVKEIQNLYPERVTQVLFNPFRIGTLLLLYPGSLKCFAFVLGGQGFKLMHSRVLSEDYHPADSVPPYGTSRPDRRLLAALRLCVSTLLVAASPRWADEYDTCRIAHPQPGFEVARDDG